jgi:hypothetical protein
MSDFWWTKWPWGRFSLSTSVSPANLYSTNFSTITITYHPGLVQEVSSGRSTQSPNPQIKFFLNVLEVGWLVGCFLRHSSSVSCSEVLYIIYVLTFLFMSAVSSPDSEHLGYNTFCGYFHFGRTFCLSLLGGSVCKGKKR